jgi:hypothetical protein
MHPIAMAECTDLPLVLSSWQVRQVAGSALGSSGTGCFAADSRPAKRRTTTVQASTLKAHFAPEIDLDDWTATPRPPNYLLHLHVLRLAGSVPACFQSVLVSACSTVS